MLKDQMQTQSSNCNELSEENLKFGCKLRIIS